MDTKQKKREDARKRTPQSGQRKRPPQTEQRKRPPQEGTKQPAQSTQRKAAAPQRKRSQSTALQAPKKKRTAPAKPAYDASETLTSGMRRTRAREPKKQSFQLQLPWNAKREKKSLSRSEQTKLRQEKRAENAQRKQQREKKMPSPVVVYTQPLSFNSSRLLVQLLTVTAVVLALVLGLSVFFKVENIVVHGAEVYSAWAVREASGITEGDNLLTFSRARANGQIQAKLPYVEKSRIGIKLPNTVNIYIEETAVTYAIQNEDGIWWLINSDGKLVEQINSAEADRHTKVLGVTLTGPVLNEQAVAQENVPTETDAAGEIIPVVVTGAQRLNSALQILAALEANDIVGDAASVDVTSLSAIELWYGTRYQVNLGDGNNMDYKVACMYDVILQLSNYQTGRLDCSFTAMPNDVVYTPFE